MTLDDISKILRKNNIAFSANLEGITIKNEKICIGELKDSKESFFCSGGSFVIQFFFLKIIDENEIVFGNNKNLYCGHYWLGQKNGK